jgi:hypothetical protein
MPYTESDIPQSVRSAVMLTAFDFVPSGSDLPDERLTARRIIRRIEALFNQSRATEQSWVDFETLLEFITFCLELHGPIDTSQSAIDLFNSASTRLEAALDRRSADAPDIRMLLSRQNLQATVSAHCKTFRLFWHTVRIGSNGAVEIVSRTGLKFFEQCGGDSKYVNDLDPTSE